MAVELPFCMLLLLTVLQLLLQLLAEGADTCFYGCRHSQQAPFKETWLIPKSPAPSWGNKAGQAKVPFQGCSRAWCGQHSPQNPQGCLHCSWARSVRQRHHCGRDAGEHPARCKQEVKTHLFVLEATKSEQVPAFN